MEVSGQLHAPAALLSGERAPWYALDTKLGGPQSRCGRGSEVKKHTIASAGNRTQVFQPVA
jgi:hypothetical protein